MNYIKKLSDKPDFSQNGLKGYNYKLDCKEITISVEDVFSGHDKYHTNKRSSKIYYVLDGNGTFSVDGNIFNVKKDDVIEIKPNTEFVFAGKMRLLLIMAPGFRQEDGFDGKDNDLY